MTSALGSLMRLPPCLPVVIFSIACAGGPQTHGEPPADSLPSGTPVGSKRAAVSTCGSQHSVVASSSATYVFDARADRFDALPSWAGGCTGLDGSVYAVSEGEVSHLEGGVWVAAPVPEGMKPLKGWGGRRLDALLIGQADGIVIAQSAGDVDHDETQRVWRLTNKGIDDLGRPDLARFTGGCSTGSSRVVLVGNRDQFRSGEDGFNHLTEELITYERGAWQTPVALEMYNPEPRVECVGESAVLLSEPQEASAWAGDEEWNDLGAEIITDGVATPVPQQAKTERRREFASVVLDNDRLIRLGGADVAGQARAETWILTVSTRTWSPGPPLASPRQGGAALLRRDGSVLVLGGTDAAGLVLGPELLRP